MSNFYCDGAFNKKGVFYCICNEDETFKEIKKCSANTSNEAEYIAMIIALKYSKKGDTIFADSQLIVNQLTKGWKVKADNLKNYFYIAEFIKDIELKGKINIKWIHRDKNKAGILLEKELKK